VVCTTTTWLWGPGRLQPPEPKPPGPKTEHSSVQGVMGKNAWGVTSTSHAFSCRVASLNTVAALKFFIGVNSICEFLKAEDLSHFFISLTPCMILSETQNFSSQCPTL
jgi:Tat protein secretion system quality control protein TatD with DNase activity